MKKRYIVFGFFTIWSVYGFGQANVKPSAKKRIARSTIDIVYGHYIQDGKHSAVTGGTGTEKLRVYSPEFMYTRQVDSLTSYSVQAGLDIISSASTDRIDFAVSSASSLDGHGYLGAGYNRTLQRKRNITLGATVSAAIESDYLSRGGGVSIAVNSRDRQQEFTASFEAFFDDLRWGRLNGVRPLRLIYPIELRNTGWFDEYRRYSYNLALSFRQVINEKTVLAIYPGLQYQEGLLSTPFHRVYFMDNSLKVENLPGKRLKIPVGVQLNNYLGGKCFLKNYYRFYWDDFDIIAHTFRTELAIKLAPGTFLTPMFRFYTQNGTPYFKPYKEHELTADFFTSDYDLSGFRSYEAGLEARLPGAGKPGVNPFVNHATMRYAFYYRSDGLRAHIITLLLSLTEQKHKPGKK